MFEKSYTHVAVISAYFESKLPRSRTSKLTRIRNIGIIINYQTVILVSTFGSGSCVSSFGSSPKVETAAVSSFGLTQKWKLRTRFQFWAVSTFGPAQAWLNGNAMFYETFICFRVSEAKPLCFSLCSQMFDDVEYTIFKMFVTQMSNYLFVISFQLMFYKTLRYR